MHSSTNLSNIDKFNYLRCYVAGNVLNTVDDWYGNKQAIITAHTKKIFKITGKVLTGQ